MQEETRSDREIVGRLFAPETASGASCQVQVTAAGFEATVKGVTCRLPIDSAELSFGGHRGSMLLVEHQTRDGKLSLYVPRIDAVAQLRALGDPEIDRRLDMLVHGSREARFGAWKLILIGLGLVSVLAWGANLGATWVLEWGIDRVPVEWEVELGKQIVESMLHGQTAVGDPVVTEGIDVIAVRLLEHVDDVGYEFQIKILEDPMVNAFAAPGGQIIVTTGIIDACESAEVLAGVLAHEIQHVVHRHSLQQLAHQLKWRVAVSLIVGQGDWLMELILSRATSILDLTHSAESERQADRGGLRLLRAAEVDPSGMVTFFAKMKAEHEGPEHSQPMFSTHPPTSERIAYLKAMIAEESSATIVPIDVDWVAVQAAAK